LTKIKEAMDIFLLHKVELILHAGDFVAPFSLRFLNDSGIEWWGVFGNNDGEREGLLKFSSGRIKEPPFFITLKEKRVALMHEFEPVEADIIIFGHTHNPQIEEKENTLVINPGEACGWLSGNSSLIIFDFSTFKPQVIYF
ncbi:MAG: hypothetical protein DRP76_01515, partial [Candidatus Omnitrophota bacterium]